MKNSLVTACLTLAIRLQARELDIRFSALILFFMTIRRIRLLGLLFLMFFVLKSYAFIVEGSGSSIVLKADSCDRIQKEVEILSSWTRRTGKTCEPRTIVVKKSRSRLGPHPYPRPSSCEAKISPCLPDYLIKYHGVSPTRDGPNCWNLALVIAGLAPYLRYSTPEEMSLLMDEPVCRALSKNEERKPGDIGAIRRKGGKEVHGFVYVSENLVYSKNGYSRINPFKLQELKSVFHVYGIDNLPDKCKQNRPSTDKSCSSHVEYFRCSTLDEYLEDGTDDLEQKMENTLSSLVQIDCNFSSLFFSKQIESGIMNLTVSLTKILLEYLQTEIRNLDTMSKKDVYLLSIIKSRLYSISMSLKADDLKSGSSSHEVQGSISVFKDLVEKSLNELDIKLSEKSHI